MGYFCDRRYANGLMRSLRLAMISVRQGLRSQRKGAGLMGGKMSTAGAKKAKQAARRSVAPQAVFASAASEPRVKR